MSQRLVATGLSRGTRTHPEHAANAVAQALARAGVGHANGVLLFLTPDYARHPEPALRAAARAADCMQVVGCTGAGVFTEEEWVLDAPGAAAMVFSGRVRLTLPARITSYNVCYTKLLRPSTPSITLSTQPLSATRVPLHTLKGPSPSRSAETAPIRAAAASSQSAVSPDGVHKLSTGRGSA